MRILIAFIVLLGATPLMAAEDYYTWVDEDGVTNYAEKNPQGYDARYISRDRRFGEREENLSGSRPGSVPQAEPEENRADSNRDSNSASANRSTPQVSPGAEDELIEDQRAAIAAKINETKTANCNIGKRNLAQLEAFARVRVTGEDGQERVLTDEEHAARINEARQLIRENCTG